MKTKATAMIAALLAGAAACVGAVSKEAGQGSSGSAGAGGTSGNATSVSATTTTTTTSTSGHSTASGVQPTSELVAHEWGTFTSVQSSIGETMEGMAHEDEPLPKFVHGRSDTAEGKCAPMKKQLEFCPKGVTQKMETPVIYFYGDVKDVTVTVGFPKGIISQWYPQAASFLPSVNPNQIGAVAGGSMTWSVLLDPTLSDKDFPYVPADDIWAPSRKVASVPLRMVPSAKAPEEKERFIFYRGLGSFDTALRIKSTGPNSIAVFNESAQPIVATYVLTVSPDLSKGRVMSLGGIPANGKIDSYLMGKDTNMAGFVSVAKSLVKQGLVDSGLTDDESQAMVDTWEKSYFKNPGTRVLYILPREWTEAILPIKISPQPKELVRTLVGRVEVMTLGEEQQVVSTIKAYTVDQDKSKALAALGRFAEPKLRRGCQLVKGDAQLKSACDHLVFEAMSQ
jgi:hypothetical protein